MVIEKIAYFVGEFPSKSETWIWNEITALIQQGYRIKVFSRDKKFLWKGNDPHSIIAKTIYRSPFFLFVILKNPIKNLFDFCRVVAKIWNDFLNDTNGLRGKLQILKDLSFFLSVSEKIKKFNPDLIIVHFANATANPVLFNYVVNKTPYIIKMHAVDVFRRPNLYRLKVALAYKVLTISKYNLEYLHNRDTDIEMFKFELHRCGIALENYEFRPRIMTRNEIPVILSVGRLAKMKGHDTLIEACYKLHRNGAIIKLFIVGNGPELENLKKLTNKFKLNHVINFKGYCPPEEVKNLLFSSDLFVLASKFDDCEIQDGIPVALMEAMATGLPVISTKISGIPELIYDKKNGFLVEPNDSGKLANKIEELLKMSTNEMRDILENARMKIEEEYNLKKLNQELINLFDEMIRK